MLLFQIKENQTLLRMVAPNFARCKEWVGREPDDQPLKIFQRCILIGFEPARLVDNDQVGSENWRTWTHACNVGRKCTSMEFRTFLPLNCTSYIFPRAEVCNALSRTFIMNHNNIYMWLLYIISWTSIMNHKNGIGLNIWVFIIVKEDINIKQDFIIPTLPWSYTNYQL